MLVILTFNIWASGSKKKNSVSNSDSALCALQLARLHAGDSLLSLRPCFAEGLQPVLGECFSRKSCMTRLSSVRLLAKARLRMTSGC